MNHRFWPIALGIACLWGTFFPLEAQWITRFGNEILNRCHLIVEGVPLQAMELHGGGTVLSFQVKAIYFGQIEFGKKISLLYPKQMRANPKERRIVFLHGLQSASAWEVIGEFVAQSSEGNNQKQALATLIAIEQLADSQFKWQKYFTYCCQGLVGKELWLQTHAFYELEYFLTHHHQRLTSEQWVQVEKLYENIPDPLLREGLKRCLVMLYRQSAVPLSQAEPKLNWAALQKQLQRAVQRLEIEDPFSPISQKVEILQLLSLFPSPDSQQGFLTALDDASPQIRSLAIFYLGSHRCHGAKAKILRLLAQDPSWRVRKNAILALGNLQATEAVGEIRRYLHNPYTQWAAEYALLQLSTKH